jgi:alkylated DNA repair dioxygenase AlkB
MRWVLLDGGELELIAPFIAPEACAALFDAVRAAVPWQEREIRIAGRWIKEPRLTAWIGDPDTAYTYSGRLNVPESWPDVIGELRRKVGAAVASPDMFNSVLCNLYRDGRDSMGLHADKEPELGEAPVIASLSLGATRRFQLRHRHVKSTEHAELAKLDLDLSAGSLLIMSGSLQHHYRHGVPKQLGVSEPRINLTFRRILPAAARAARA